MGRPLNSKYFGQQTGSTKKIVVSSAWLPQEGSAISNAFIVKQLSMSKFLVENPTTGNVGICYLVQNTSQAGHLTINATTQATGSGAILTPSMKALTIALPGGSGAAITPSMGASAITLPTGSGATLAPSMGASAITLPAGSGATLTARMKAITVAVATGGSGYAVNDTVTLTGGTAVTPITINVLTVDGGGAITSLSIATAGIYTVLPANPVAQGSTSASGTGATFNVTSWGIDSITIGAGGSGYTNASASVTGGGGAGAVVSVTMSGGVINTANVTTAGSGYTSIPTITVNPNGSGYAVNDTITLTGGTFSAAIVAKVTTVTATGSVTAATIQTAGAYTVLPASPIAQGSTSGVGVNAKINVSSWLLASVSITSGGSGYTNASASVTGGGGAGAVVSVTMSGGVINTANVTTAGSGYTSIPTVTVNPNGSGYAVNDTITLTGGTFSQAIVAKVTTVSTTGSVTGATIQTAGAYTVLPTNPVAQGSTSGVGNGAKINISSWLLALATIASGGSGYTNASASVTGGGGAGATVSITMASGVINTSNVTAGGSGYTSIPTITVNTNGTGYAVNDTITLTGGTFGQAIVAKVTTVSTTGSVTAATIQTAGAYTVLPTNPVAQGSTSGSGINAKINISTWGLASVAITNGGSGYSSATVTVIGGGGGTGATVTPTLTSGAISSNSVVAGSGYTSIPAINVLSSGSTEQVKFIYSKQFKTWQGNAYLWNDTETANDSKHAVLPLD